MSNFGSAGVQYAALVLGGSILLYTPWGSLLKSYALLSEPFVACAFGIIFGPLGAGWINPQAWSVDTRLIELEVARYTIAVQVVNVGTDLPTPFLRAHWSSILSSITVVMAAMWFISSALVLAVFPELSVLQATLTGACITPTDPVLSSVLVHGRFAEHYVPENVRHLLSAESAANDGLALPLVALPLLLLQFPAGAAIGRWFYNAWL
jgi:NhaP-type Na+/H+ or K+/H+ antiporter